jgi:thiol-disulfide isomerase/thioredoxin
MVLSAGAMALAGPALAKKGDAPLPPPLGELAGLALMRADGTATTLGAETGGGRAAVVSLWATWCAPCLQEAQHLSKLRPRFAEEQLAIVGINVDKARDETKIAQFLSRGKVNFTQLRGDPDTIYKAFNGSPPITLPRLYVFALSGQPTHVFGRYSGSKTLKEIDRAVEAAAKA